MVAATWVQTGELATLFGILAEVLAALRTLAQRRHAHLWLAVVTRAAQTRVVPLWREVVALVHNVIFYIHTSLPCEEERNRQDQVSRTFLEEEEDKRALTPLAEEGELLVTVLSVPAVEASLIHALDLKALQLGTEDVVLGGRRLPKIGETLRWEKHLHRP